MLKGSPSMERPRSSGNVEKWEMDGARWEDQQEVEEDIEEAHHHIGQRRYLDVAGAAQHGRCQHIDHRQRGTEGEDEEVEGGVGADVVAAAQPMWQREGDEGSDGHGHSGKRQGGQQALAEDGARSGDVVGSHAMSHLNGETGGGARDDAPEEPHRRGHNANTG